MIIEKAFIKGYYQGRLSGQYSCVIGTTRIEVIKKLLILKNILNGNK